MIAPSFAETFLLNVEPVDSLVNQVSAIMPDVVVNTIALTNVDKCELNPILAYKSNVNTAANIALACKKLDIPLVHFSTDHLFAGESLYTTENSICSPLNTYGNTKLQAERVVAECWAKSLIVRTNFYGWGTSYRQSFTDRVLNSLQSGETFSAFNDVFFTPVLIEDLVSVVNCLIDLEVFGVYNIVSDKRVSKHDVALSVARIFDFRESLIKSASIDHATSLVSRPKDMSLSNLKVCSLIKRKLGSVEEGILKLKHQQTIPLYQELRNL